MFREGEENIHQNIDSTSYIQMPLVSIDNQLIAYSIIKERKGKSNISSNLYTFQLLVKESSNSLDSFLFVLFAKQRISIHVCLGFSVQCEINM